MKLRAITLENIRRFVDPVRMTGIADGLNVLSAPNEFGKSTLFDAIHALFFIPHGSRSKEITALRPHAGGAPEITIEIETCAGTFTLSKRWFSKPLASVMQGSRLVAQADAAEAWIADMLGGVDNGPWGLVWVRQGVTGLDGGSTRDQSRALEARRDLLSSVSDEIDAMTGGRRMDKALARCRDELGQYITGKSRGPRKGGPLQACLERLEALVTQRDTLAATARSLHEALAQRKSSRRQLADLEDPDLQADRQARLEQARQAHRAAEEHATALDTQRRRVEAARLAVNAARTRLDGQREAAREHQQAQAAVSEAERHAQAARVAHDAGKATLAAAELALTSTQAALKQAETDLDRARRVQAARDGAARRADLVQRITEAEKARSAMESAQVAARIGPDAAGLRRLDDLAGRLRTARATRDASAAQVTVRYAKGQQGRISADGKALAEAAMVPLSRVTLIEIEGLGALEFRPGQSGAEVGAVEAAEQALGVALKAAGVADIDAAHAAAAARSAAQQSLDQARAVFESLAPQGLDALRAALAAIPESPEEDQGADPEQAEAALIEARAAQEAARLARDAGAKDQGDSRDAATRTETALNGACERLTRAAEALTRHSTVSEQALAADMDAALQALKTAETLHEEQARSAPDLAATEAALTRLTSVETQARSDIILLRQTLATLNERIARQSGDAVEEQLAETEQQLAAAQAEQARLEHEVAVLIRLEGALETARQSARDRYFAPVLAELKPLLALLWPEAEMTWEQDRLLPGTLVRGGQEEAIDVLSGGTQEQLTLLTRLAFARMLAKAGRAAPVILDDALVFTDDDRIERMFDALHRQAGELQIIVLTCRQRAFRDLGGNTLRLEQRP